MMAFFLFCSAALACPVCGGGDAPNQQAFFDTMVFMSLLPLGLIGGVSYVVVKRYREIAAREAEAAEAT